jgi:hypothetical protein
LIDLNPKNECNNDATVAFVPMSLMSVNFLEAVRYEEKKWFEVKKGYTNFADGDVLSAAVSKKFIDNTHGINIYHIGKENLAAFPIYFPPLAEQTEIARRVEALFSLADKLEARYRQARVRVEKLVPALLAKAFRGELVPQDPA